MNSPRLWLTLLAVAATLLFQACGANPPEKPKPAEDSNLKVISQLQSSLGKLREDLDKEKRLNSDLTGQVTTLQGQIKELEEKAAKAVEPPEKPLQEEPERSELAPDTRVSLMGAKAVAEFKAQQLNQRLDEVTKLLSNKHKELQEIRRNAKQKEAEVAKLSETVKQLQAQEAERAKDMNARLEAVSKDLAARSEQAEALKKELDEKSELLNALKVSVTDTAKLKAVSEAEVEKLTADLKAYADKAQTLEKQLHDALTEVQRYQAGEDELRRVAEQWRESAEQLKADAESYASELEQLKEKVKTLEGQLKAAQKAAEEPSPVDAILQYPTPGPAPEKERSLY